MVTGGLAQPSQAPQPLRDPFTDLFFGNESQASGGNGSLTQRGGGLQLQPQPSYLPNDDFQQQVKRSIGGFSQGEILNKS